MQRVMVDMSATLLHHGHIRLLKAASLRGLVVVGLTEDADIARVKGYPPELSFAERKEILESIVYVSEVVPTPWLINDSLLDRFDIDVLIHGDDNSNAVSPSRLLVLPRTPDISSELLREKAAHNLSLLHAAQRAS